MPYAGRFTTVLAALALRLVLGALLWLGVPGLDRRGLYDRHMRTIAEDDDVGEPWLAQYRDYDADVWRLWQFR